MTDETQVPKIIVRVPDKNTPGYARRLHRAAMFSEQMKKEFTPKLIEDMIGFLSDFIEGKKQDALDYLWDCTQVQFEEMIGAVGGGSTEIVPPPLSEG